jgi:cell division protease FtsH
LKDRYLTSKSELNARMAAAMGGRAAEEIIFGDVTTGAKQDIEHATTIARQMVCEFGMSERLGLVTLHRKGDGDSQFFSELTAADVDAEVKALTDAAYRQAYNICHARRATLVRIAEHLQIVETIDGPELDRLLLEDTVPSVVVVSPEVKSAVAARIAAAEANDWEELSSGSAHDSEGLPPIAAT